MLRNIILPPPGRHYVMAAKATVEDSLKKRGSSALRSVPLDLLPMPCDPFTPRPLHSPYYYYEDALPPGAIVAGFEMGESIEFLAVVLLQWPRGSRLLCWSFLWC